MMRFFLNKLWKIFNAMPEGRFKTRLRLSMAFHPLLPRRIQRMSPIRASINNYQPQPGDVVVDAGAFPADFTIYASRRVGPQGRVLAFEPNPVNYAVLQGQVRAFGCINVTVLPYGLWDSDCEMNMAGSGVDAQLEQTGAHKVKLVALDLELARLGIAKVDMIKMDIEGAEPEALLGSTKTLSNYPVNLAIACYHEVAGHETRTAIERLVTGLGYQYVIGFPERMNLYGWRSAPGQSPGSLSHKSTPTLLVN